MDSKVLIQKAIEDSLFEGLNKEPKAIASVIQSQWLKRPETQNTINSIQEEYKKTIELIISKAGKRDNLEQLYILAIRAREQQQLLKLLIEGKK